jgi:methyl halide transferase
MYALLKPGGKIAGVLFNKNFKAGPSVSGNKYEYQNYSSRFFQLKQWGFITILSNQEKELNCF